MANVTRPKLYLRDFLIEPITRGGWQLKWDVYQTIAILVGVIMLLIYASRTGGVQTFATCTLIAGVALAAGLLLGFLFGIPKDAQTESVKQQPTQQQAAQQQPAQQQGAQQQGAQQQAGQQQIGGQQGAQQQVGGQQPAQQQVGPQQIGGQQGAQQQVGGQQPAQQQVGPEQAGQPPAPPALPAPPAPTNPSNQSKTLPTKSTLKANTNLVEISDWLTKMIVGVGLYQLSTLPGKLRILADYFATSFGSPAAPSALVMAILGYFGIFGFLLGYLWARIYLTKEFEDDVTAQQEAS